MFSSASLKLLSVTFFLMQTYYCTNASEEGPSENYCTREEGPNEAFTLSSSLFPILYVNNSDMSSRTYIEPSVQPDNVSLTFFDDFACPGKTVTLTCETYNDNGLAWYYNGTSVRYYTVKDNHTLGMYMGPENEDDFPNITFLVLLASNQTNYTSILKVSSEIAVTNTIDCKSGFNSSSSSYTYRVLDTPKKPNISCHLMTTITDEQGWNLYKITWKHDGNIEDISYFDVTIIDLGKDGNLSKSYNKTCPCVNTLLVPLNKTNPYNISIKVVDKCEQTNENHITIPSMSANNDADLGCDDLLTSMDSVARPLQKPNITSSKIVSPNLVYNITWEQEDISNEDIAYYEITINQTDPVNFYPGVNSALISVHEGNMCYKISVKVVNKCDQTNESSIFLPDEACKPTGGGAISTFINSKYTVVINHIAIIILTQLFK